MKTKMFILTMLGLICCGGSTVGVDQAFIETTFNLDSSTNPTILSVDPSGVCPHFEFDLTNAESFQLLISDGNPVAKETTFLYADTAYDQNGVLQILSSENEAGSTFELTYDSVLAIYSIDVDYNCQNLEENLDCTNTTFSCTGPFQ